MRLLLCFVLALLLTACAIHRNSGHSTCAASGRDDRIDDLDFVS